MPQTPKYLSTDPDEGEPVPGNVPGTASSKYLSTDPSAGSSAPMTWRDIRDAALEAVGRAGGAGVPGGDVGAWLAKHIVGGILEPENAPALAATAAGVATGGAGLLPAAAAAGVAGAAGAGMRHIGRELEGRELDQPLTETAKQAAEEGALQGGLQLAGGALTKAAGPVGKFLYRKALAPSKALQREFPDIVETGLEGGFNVTSKGAEQAAAARAASAAQARDMVAAAAPTAEPVRANEILPAFRPAYKALQASEAIGKDVSADRAALAARAKRVAQSFGGKPGVPAEPDRVVTLSRAPAAAAETGDEAVVRAGAELGPQAELAPSSVFEPSANEVRVGRELGAASQAVPRRLISGQPAAREPLQFVSPGRPAIPAEPGGIDLLEAQARKETGQGAAEAAYKRRALGQPVNDIEALTDEKVAKAYQNAIERRIPDIAAQNQNTRSLIGITRALDDAELRPHVLGWLMGMASGGGAGAEAAAKHIVFTSPRALGRAGIILDRIGQTDGQIPAALGRALIQALRQDNANNVLPPLAQPGASTVPFPVPLAR